MQITSAVKGVARMNVSDQSSLLENTGEIERKNQSYEPVSGNFLLFEILTD